MDQAQSALQNSGSTPADFDILSKDFCATGADFLAECNLIAELEDKIACAKKKKAEMYTKMKTQIAELEGTTPTITGAKALVNVALRISAQATDIAKKVCRLALKAEQLCHAALKTPRALPCAAHAGSSQPKVAKAADKVIAEMTPVVRAKQAKQKNEVTRTNAAEEPVQAKSSMDKTDIAEDPVQPPRNKRMRFEDAKPTGETYAKDSAEDSAISPRQGS